MIGKIAEPLSPNSARPARAHASSSNSSELLRRLMPSGDETAMKTAMYNTLFFVVALMGVAGLFAIYHLLYMFLKPMLWAALVGTVLFPFKRKVTTVMRDWLTSLRESHTPLVVGTLLLPWNWLNNIAEKCWQLMVSRTGCYVVLAYLTLKILTYERAFMTVIGLIARAYEIVDALIAIFTKKWIIPLVLMYFCAYVAWVYVQPDGQVNKKLARLLSVPMWFFALAFTAQYFGPLRVVVFVVSAIAIALIAAGVIGGEDDDDDKATAEKDVTEIVKEVDDEIATRKKSAEPPVTEVIEHTLQLDEALTGDSYLRIIFGLCFLLWTVRHGWMLTLLFVPLLFAAVKTAGESIGIFAALQNGIGSAWDSVYRKLKKLLDVTFAGSLRKFIRLLFTSDRMFVGALEQSIDVVSSVVVMLALALGSLLMVLFVAFQLHGETVHLIKLGSNVISSQPDWLATAVNFTEGHLAEHDIDNYVEQAYTQGRTWLATKVRSLADASDTERADLLEKQVKVMVDNIYQMWEQRTAHSITANSKQTSDVDFFGHIKHATDLTALKEELTLIVKENMETLMTIAQSVWGVLASNMSFLTSIVVALLGLVLNFGMELINFLIEVVVFMTMVYFLLANSKDRWLPLEWMSSMTPEVVGSGGHVTSCADTHTITGAIEQAISGVFVLSAKMAIFYGLFTWFVHTLFDLNIVFVPSILATMFAAVPIMPPYLVAVVGGIELWLVRGEITAAVIFVLVSFSPVMFADGAFYKEVKGSHPYVTGLAIIGGMYWLGLEGALIGPIILCVVLVMVHVYARFAHPDSPVH